MNKSVLTKQAEIDANYKIFRALLPDLLKEKKGKFLVLRHSEAIESFDTMHDAIIFASRSYDDGLFSVQEITDKVIDMGWYSDAPAHFKIRQ
ncbi:MAG: hypothetical protein AB7E52_07530 [Bdellovibrionales bacterium]